MVGCFSFKYSINFLSFSSPCSQRKKMPSMYLHHRYGLNSISRKIYSSNSAINNILYGGANLVPVAVPHFFFEVFSINVKILFLRTTSASSASAEVVTSFSYLRSSRLRRADIPSSCGMLGYKPTTNLKFELMPTKIFL